MKNNSAFNKGFRSGFSGFAVISSGVNKTKAAKSVAASALTQSSKGFDTDVYNIRGDFKKSISQCAKQNKTHIEK